MPFRSRFDLTLEILQACKTGAGITRVVSQCGFCHKTAKSHIDELIGLGVIVREGNLYYTTERGQKLLARLEAARDSLESGKFAR